MWDTDTYWFDISLVLGICAIGNILLGHFEEHKPKWRRLLKIGIVLGIALVLSYFQLRWVLYLLIALIGLCAAYIHVIWLPRHGINGWTGEPREKYLELVSGRKKQRAP